MAATGLHAANSSATWHTEARLLEQLMYYMTAHNLSAEGALAFMQQLLQQQQQEEGDEATGRVQLLGGKMQAGDNSSVYSTANSSGHDVQMGDMDPCDADPFNYLDYTQLAWVKWTFIVLYALVIAVSTVGNLMVIWTVWRNKHMRTVTNYYIVNLAVADLLVSVFVMPLVLLEFTAPCTWKVFARDTLCSFLHYILPVFVFTSVLTLVAISLERCYAIVYPLNAMAIHSKSRTRRILAATWAVPLIVAAPYLFCKSYAFNIHSQLGSVSRQICTDRFDDIDVAIYGDHMHGSFRMGFFLFLFVAIYLLPLVVIVTTCIRIALCLLQPITNQKPESTQALRMTRRREENKRKVARMIIIVALAFIVSWSPFYLVTLVSQLQSHSFLRRSNFVFTMLAIHLAGFTSSALNPLIYHFMSDKFRKSFRSIVCSVLHCRCRERSGRTRQSEWGSLTDADYGSSGNDVTLWRNMPLSSFRSSLKNGWRSRQSQHHHHHQAAQPTESVRMGNMAATVVHGGNCYSAGVSGPKAVRCVVKKNSGTTVLRLERHMHHETGGTGDLASQTSQERTHTRAVPRTGDRDENGSETDRLLNETYDVIENGIGSTGLEPEVTCNHEVMPHIHVAGLESRKEMNQTGEAFEAGPVSAAQPESETEAGDSREEAICQKVNP